MEASAMTSDTYSQNGHPTTRSFSSSISEAGTRFMGRITSSRGREVNNGASWRGGTAGSPTQKITFRCRKRKRSSASRRSTIFGSNPCQITPPTHSSLSSSHLGRISVIQQTHSSQPRQPCRSVRGSSPPGPSTSAALHPSPEPAPNIPRQ